MLITPAFLHQIKNCYDIRSTKFSNDDALLFGKAFGSELIEYGKKRAVIGYDRRRYSKQIHDFFIEGLLSTGVDVISIGPATTPMVQIAEFELETDASISVTASHNPPEYQGLKLFLDKHSFADINLAKLGQRILDENFKIGFGKLEFRNFNFQYAQLLEKKLTPLGNIKIAWDFVNGSSAEIFPYLTKLFKGSHYILNHANDPNFGGFAPDPTFEPRLEELKNLIKDKNLDFGIALDGDSDRCIVIDKHGKTVPGDNLSALFGYLTHKIENRNIKMIWDSKSSSVLIKWARSFAQSAISVTGHSNLYNALRKTDSDIACETSGHYMFKDHYGVNDGFFAAFKLINYLKQVNLSLDEALNLLPTKWTFDPAPIKCAQEDKDHVIRQIANILQKQGITMDLSDGVKACYSYGWWMIRPSRTEEILRISAEGWTEEGLEDIKDHMHAVVSSIVL